MTPQEYHKKCVGFYIHFMDETPTKDDSDGVKACIKAWLNENPVAKERPEDVDDQIGQVREKLVAKDPRWANLLPNLTKVQNLKSKQIVSSFLFSFFYLIFSKTNLEHMGKQEMF